MKNNLIKNWPKDLNRYFYEEDIQMANSIHKKMFNIITHYYNAVLAQS